MSKVIFVAGEKGAGKSTFILRNYQSESHYVLADFKGFKEGVEKKVDEEDEFWIEVYNDSLGEMFDAYFDDKDIVIEVCLGTGYDDEFLNIIHSSDGLDVSLNMLECSKENREERIVQAEKEGKYYSSEFLVPHLMEVYKGFLESIQMSKGMGYLGDGN